ncbi:hypothetical protein ACWDG1_14395 [Streptomyces sp. NPDC001177]
MAGDVAGWWDDFAFTTNVLSSLAGVGVGVPFALLFIDQLSVERAELSERRAASLRATLAAESLGADLVLPVQAPLRQSAREHLHRLVTTTDAAHDVLKNQLRMLCDQLSDFIDDSEFRDDPDPFRQMLFPQYLENGHESPEVVERLEVQYLANTSGLAEVVAAASSELIKSADAVSGALISWTDQGWNRWCEHVQSEWQTLERESRQQLSMAGLQWLPAGRTAAVREAFRNIEETRFIEALASKDWNDGAFWEEALYAGNVVRTFSGLVSLVAEARDWARNLAVLAESAEFASGFFRQQAPP